MNEPLTPADCDLSDFPSMFIDVRRLLTSETWIEAAEHPRLGHVLMCLWMESWHQRPAASLPDNDAVLARLAMCDLKTWKKLRNDALAGWVMCSDGRWYHPVVAEKAMEAWERKQAFRNRTAKAREARHAKRQTETVDAPSEATTEDVTTPVTVSVTETRGRGRGIGIGTGILLNDRLNERASDFRNGEGVEVIPSSATELAAECARIAGIANTAPAAIMRNAEVVDAWLKSGCDPAQDILPAISARTAETKEPIHSLRYFDKEVHHRHAKRLATASNVGTDTDALKAYASRWVAEHPKEPGWTDDEWFNFRGMKAAHEWAKARGQQASPPAAHRTIAGVAGSMKTH